VHPDHPKAPPPSGEPHDDIIYPSTVPFVLVHLAVFGAIWTGVSATAVWVAVALYLVRMWAITAGFHRYFSHRSYKTSRAFQFALAFLAQTSAQRGALWWAAIHRHHHKHSDTPEDVHSPVHMGFWASHVGWIFRPKRNTADFDSIQDLTRYPELVWLNRFHLVPAILLAVACFLAGGWQMLVVGFFWSTVALYHGTFFINSLAHVVGSQRYVTGDDSRNNWWLALITLGEGWHNNHHHYQSATAQGWRWYEIDISYYLLKALSWTGLVWDLLAATVPVRKMVDDLKARWDQLPGLEEIRASAVKAREDAEARLEEYLATLSHLEIPTVEELRARALRMYADTPSVDEIAERARELVLEAISAHLLEPGVQPA
jgi:stearoyl-CoA desaturase (delta-9 desaturase)